MHFKGLDLNLLVALDALLAERNITRAGVRVCLSQPAMSGALARLRDFFQDELLVQVGQKMVPTALAEDLAPKVHELLLHTEALIQRNGTFNPSASNRHFRLAMSDYTASVLVSAGAMARLQQVAPKVTVELRTDVDRRIEALERGEIDVLITPKGYGALHHPSQDLYADGSLCLVWAEHPSVGDTISLEQYMELGHVAIGFGRAPAVGADEEYFRSTGVRRRVEVVATAFNLIPQLLIGTTRIATIPGRLARLYVRHLPLRVIQPPLEFPQLVQMMQWHRSRTGDPGNIWLRGLLRECLPPEVE